MSLLNRSNWKSWRLTLALLLLALIPLLPSLVQTKHLVQASTAATAPDLLFPFVVHLGLCCLILALVARVRILLFVLLPAAALGLLESFYLLQFGTATGPHVYGIIADTHRDEVLSWIGPWLFPLMLATLAVLSLLWWAARQCWLADLAWRGWTRWCAVAAAAVLGSFLMATEAIIDAQAAPFRDSGHYYILNPLQPAPDGMRAQFENSFPWGLPWRLWRFSEHWKVLQSHQARIASFRFGVARAVAAPGDAREVYVLVIGETARANRWGLYGAPRGTTPLLSARKDLVVFADATSGASATRESVNLMLTRRAPEAMLEPTGEPSAVTLFRQAGFKTYWFSTQGTAGTHETPISVMARESHQVQFINGADYKGNGALDGQLLPLLRQALGERESRQFIVLHTLGSHLNYAHRYPSQFERYRPALQASDRPDLWAESTKERMINSYDNSVLYTDTVLNQVIEEVAALGAVATILYVADHGEGLFDGNCRKAGHGFPAKVNYHVPMFAWMSPEWQAWRPGVAGKIKARSQLPISTLSVFPTLAGLAGLAIPAPHAHPDLSGDIARSLPRMVTHHGDFDRDIRDRGCDTQSRTSQGSNGVR